MSLFPKIVSANISSDESLTGFAPGTLVVTSNGYTPIEKLRAGDLVASDSFDFRPKKTEMRQREDVAFRPVSRVLTIENQHLSEVMVFDLAAGIKESIFATSAQLFYEDPTGWLTASQLGFGNALVNTVLGNILVRKIKKAAAPAMLVAIEVEEFRTYYVGQLGVWVRDQSHLVHSSDKGSLPH
jgi:hypothetical protein